jgi:hypothetical protein
MSLLTILQNAAAVLSLPQPQQTVGSPSLQTQNLLGLAQIGGRALARSHPWQILTVRREFVVATSQPQQIGEPPPADYDHLIPLQRIWDITRRTWLIGPVSANEWDGLVTKEVTTSPSYWILLGGVLNIWPAPAVGDSFRYSYVSKNWIKPETGPNISRWAASTDVSLLDESLHELDLIWRFKQGKGLDYAEDMQTFEREKEKAIARDRGPREITTTAPIDMPDNFWPGTIVETAP